MLSYLFLRTAAPSLLSLIQHIPSMISYTCHKAAALDVVLENDPRVDNMSAEFLRCGRVQYNLCGIHLIEVMINDI